MHSTVRAISILGACAALSCSLAETPQKVSPVPARPAWDSFDRVLQSILLASRDSFRTVEGVRIENRRREFYFEAKTYLPGASYCRVLEGPAYCCEWDVAAQAAATSLYEKLSDRIKAALGAEWTKTTKSAKARKDTLFGAEGKAAVQVILHTTPLKVYVVVLTAGSSKDGYVGNIPAIEDFLHP